MSSKEVKVVIINEIENIFAMVNKRSINKKRSAVDIRSNMSNISNCIRPLLVYMLVWYTQRHEYISNIVVWWDTLSTALVDF